MAFDLNKKKGPISDINVTPLVDVMLVLLVIFMISAPLMFSGIKLKLPKTKKVNNVSLNTKQVILSMTKEEDFYLGKKKLSLKETLIQIKKEFKANNTDVLYLRADYILDYGKVAKVMSLLKINGIDKISLVTEIESK